MGKRKRTSDHKKPPAVSCLHSDIMPCSFGMDLPSQEKPSSVVSSVSAAVNPLPSVMDTTDSSVKQPNTHPSHRHYHYNLSRATFIRRSLHNHGNQFSQQNSGIHTDTLSSLCKSASPLRDEKLSFKLASQCSSESGHHAERKPFHRSERIRSSPFAMDSISPDVAKMACGICLKLLRRKACNLGNSLSSSGLSVVAVLVCGHVYHADCLEQRTSEGDRCDPPCPLCVDLSLKIGASGGQD